MGIIMCYFVIFNVVFTLSVCFLPFHITLRGYQQCIASVVTNLVGNKLPGGVGYRVDEGTVQRLQILLQDGNVDK